MRRRRLLTVLFVAAALAGLLGTSAFVWSDHHKFARVKHANDQYQDVGLAQRKGFGLLADKDGITCIDMPGMGAMGVHYVNGDLVGDGKIDALHPEAMVYEPLGGGKLRLVAAEYVVFQKDWNAKHHGRPVLFGKKFDPTPEGNRYGLPAFYSLHVWLWKNNPAGTLKMWNPRVSCGHSDHSGH
jgi:hypothetical protein